jgi:predicted small lipoprotein YifL
MIRAALIIAFFALTACGADGPPITPSVNTTVSVGSEGVRTSTGVTINRGPVTVGASF